MNKKVKISFILGGILILLVGVVGITFAYLSTGGSQEQANTFTSGCLSISLTNESNSINLTSVYPISDIEGLETTSYDFTITNNCSSQAKYQINLESLNEVANTLNAEYIKVSLSSDTVGNVISKLSDNFEVTPALDESYQSHNLYTDSLEANGSKTYHLKLWIDYDATKEQAASKTYISKINVIANPETSIIDNLEATFTTSGTTLTANLTNGVTSATYCTTTDNICVPSTSANIANNSFNINLESNDNKQMVCTKLNGTSKVICSNPMEIAKTLLADAILAQEGGAQAIESKGIPDFSQAATTDEGIYAAQDEDNKTSYYYRGAADDNWVKFAGFYWRIIRINGDGSIRLIYQGTSANTTGTGTQIKTSAFNSTRDHSRYVGLVYGSETDQHGYGNNSTIMGELNTWYTNNIKDTEYEDDIDTGAGFCSDRGPTSSSWTNAGFEYAAYDRIRGGNPSLDCSDEDILSADNGRLDNPIGLITADEVMYGGIPWSGSTTSNYLYTGQYYWTMSPYFFNYGYARVFYVDSAGNLYDGNVNWTGPGVRPVINLKADTVISSGDGSADLPFVVQTD